MKFRRPWLMRLLGKAAALLIRCWMRTTVIREYVEDPSVHPRFHGKQQPIVGAAWHELLLIAAWHYHRFANTAIITSHSADGELMASIARSMDWDVVRGSSSRGGAGALHSVVHYMRNHRPGRPMLTCDGPRGPRMRAKPGAIYLASQTGAPIVPLGVACDRPWRAKSWDRLLLPRPGRRIQLYLGSAINVPPDLTKQEVVHWQAIVEKEIERVNRLALELLKYCQRGDLGGFRGEFRGGNGVRRSRPQSVGPLLVTGKRKDQSAA